MERKRAAAIKASAISLPSAADLMAGGSGAGSGGGVFHNPYEQQDIRARASLNPFLLRPSPLLQSPEEI